MEQSCGLVQRSPISFKPRQRQSGGINISRLKAHNPAAMNRKTICLLVSAVVFDLVVGVNCFSQNDPGTASPPFEIVKLKWEKQARLPQDFDPSNGGASGGINDSATSGSSSRGGGGGGG